MRRVLSFALAASALLPAALVAQTPSPCPTGYAQVIATKIGANTKLATGQLTVVATDASHNPINYSVPGIGIELTKAKRDPIVTGAITQLLCLPMSDHTSIPVGYHFTARDTSPGGGNGVVLDAQDVAITTNPFSLDDYPFLKNTDPYTLTSVTQTIGGLSQLTGDVTAQGTGSEPATVVGIHGTSVPVSDASDQALVTSAAQVGSWMPLPACGDATHALSYSVTKHSFGCQTVAGGGGEPGNFYSSSMSSGGSGTGGHLGGGGGSSPNALAIAAANDANGIAVIDPLAASDAYDPTTLASEARLVDNLLGKDLQYSVDPPNATGLGNNHHEHACTTNTLPDDQGGENNRASACLALDTVVNNSGYNGGSGYLASGGSLGNAALAINVEDHSAGTHPIISINGGTYSVGDRNHIAQEFTDKIGSTDASGEAVSAFFRMHENSSPVYLGTVTGAADGNNETAITATCVTSCGTLGVGHPLVNLSSKVQAKVSAVSGNTVTLTDMAGNPLTLPASSGNGTLAADVNVPRGALTDIEPALTTVSLLLNTTVAYNNGDIIDLSGGPYRETAQLSNVGSLSGGTQTAQASLRWSHGAGSYYFVNGFQGYIEDEKFPTTNGKHYYLNVDGSPSASSIRSGLVYLGAYWGAYVFAAGDTVDLYTGAEVVNVYNVATRKSDGLYVGVMPTQPGTWAAGNSIANPDHAGQSVRSGQFNNFNADNPFAAWGGWEENFYGAGVSSSQLSPNGSPKYYHTINNANDPSLYITQPPPAPATGKILLSAPNGIRWGGLWGNGFTWDYAPTGGSLPSLSSSPCLLCVSNGFAPNAPLVGDEDYDNGTDGTGTPSHFLDLYAGPGGHIRYNGTQGMWAIDAKVNFLSGIQLGLYASLHLRAGTNVTQRNLLYVDYFSTANGGTPGVLCTDANGLMIQCAPDQLQTSSSDPTVNGAAFFPQAQGGTDNIVAHDATVPGLYNKGGQLWYQQPNGTVTPTQAKLPETQADIEAALGSDFAQLVTAPASSTSTCIAGQTAYDASCDYRCIATNTWARAAHSTW